MPAQTKTPGATRSAVILTTFKDGDSDVEWCREPSGRYRVAYGLQVNTFADSLLACREFGECVRHSLECAGKLD